MLSVSRAGARRQSWKEGQSLHVSVSKHSWDTSWEQFHTKTSALQISDCCCCGRESCWSYVNLKMGGVGSCQMDIWPRDPLQTRLEDAREKVGRKVVCIVYQEPGAELGSLHISSHFIFTVILGSINPSIPEINLNLRQRG